MWGALRNPGFRWLWMGQVLSQLGNAIFLIMGLWEIQLRSPFLLSIAGLGMSLPSLLGVAGGVFADRYPPARLMLGTDVLRGSAVLAGLLVVWWHPSWIIGVIIAVISIASLGNALFGPSELVVLTQLVPSDDLASANGLTAVTNQFAMAVGAGIGGAAIATIGVKLIFGLDMVAYWLSAAALLLMVRWLIRMKPGEPTMTRMEITAQKPAPESFGQSLKNGWQGLKSMPWFMALIAPVVVSNFAFMAAFTMLPYWMRHVLHAGPAAFGMADGGWSLGLLAGSLLSGVVGRYSLRKSVGILNLVTSVFSVGFILAGNSWLAAAMLLLAGVANGLVNALFLTFIQKIVPQNLLGRVMGLIITLFGLATPLGTMAAGVSLHVLPLSWAWILGAVTAIPVTYMILTKVPDLPTPMPVSDGPIVQSP